MSCFSLVTFKNLFLVLVFCNLIMVCLGMYFFRSHLRLKENTLFRAFLTLNGLVFHTEQFSNSLRIPTGFLQFNALLMLPRVSTKPIG